MKRILIVDDEPDVLESLGTLLRRNGYSVLAVNSGEEGLRVAKIEPPDLIILDLVLPDKDGSDVASELLRNSPTSNVPIIFLTSMMRREEQLSASPMIANRCIIAKPCSGEEILAQVRSRLGPPA